MGMNIAVFIIFNLLVYHINWFGGINHDVHVMLLDLVG
jgi:hypothetical protein